jgi:hypothetical protein
MKPVYQITEEEKREVVSFFEQIKDIEYHSQGMGCGLEDREITDRYEAMRHGWDEAMEAVRDRFPTPETLETIANLPVIPQNAEGGQAFHFAECQGCGAVLKPSEVEVYGSGFCHVIAVADSHGDPTPEPCGPVHRLLNIDLAPTENRDAGGVDAWSIDGWSRAMNHWHMEWADREHDETFPNFVAKKLAALTHPAADSKGDTGTIPAGWVQIGKVIWDSAGGDFSPDYKDVDLDEKGIEMAAVYSPVYALAAPKETADE